MALLWHRARDVDVALCAAVSSGDATSVASLLRCGASPTAVVHGACILSHVTDPTVAHVLARTGASMSILLCLDNILTRPHLLRAVLTDAPPRIVTHLRVPSYSASTAGFNGVRARYGGAVTVLLRLTQHAVSIAASSSSTPSFMHHVSLCACMLIAAGVPLQERDAAGRTALAVAAAAGAPAALLCAVLVAAGTDMRLCDAQGETALARMAVNVHASQRGDSVAVIAQSMYNAAGLAAWTRRAAAIVSRDATLRAMAARKRARRV